MYPLVESLRIENRQLCNVSLHNKRINAALKAVYGLDNLIRIEEIVQIPEDISEERYKCRLVFYPDKVDYAINLYHQREIKTLRVVTDDAIDYTYKNEDRGRLDAAYALRDGCDDIIIVKNGHVTDSWAANILFYDGEKWVTPNTPLLNGTQREYLLLNSIIAEQEITVDAILQYQKVSLVNAMIDFDRAPEIVIPDGVFF